MMGDLKEEHINCPNCGEPHVDVGEWRTRPHHKHLCHFCHHIWRLDYYAVGQQPEYISEGNGFAETHHAFGFESGLKYATANPPPGYALVRLEGAEERVARAIYANRPARINTPSKDDNWTPVSWDEAQELVPDRIEDVTQDAQAAIKAMVEGE